MDNDIIQNLQDDKRHVALHILRYYLAIFLPFIIVLGFLIPDANIFKNNNWSSSNYFRETCEGILLKPLVGFVILFVIPIFVAIVHPKVLQNMYHADRTLKTLKDEDQFHLSLTNVVFMFVLFDGLILSLFLHSNFSGYLLYSVSVNIFWFLNIGTLVIYTPFIIWWSIQNLFLTNRTEKRLNLERDHYLSSRDMFNLRILYYFLVAILVLLYFILFSILSERYDDGLFWIWFIGTLFIYIPLNVTLKIRNKYKRHIRYILIYINCLTIFIGYLVLWRFLVDGWGGC